MEKTSFSSTTFELLNLDVEACCREMALHDPGANQDAVISYYAMVWGQTEDWLRTYINALKEERKAAAR